MSNSGMSTHNPTSPARVIALIANRELTTRARTKSFVISNLIILVLIVGGLIAASLFIGGVGGSGGPKVGLVGSAASLSTSLSAPVASGGIPKTLKTSTVKDEATARAQVTSGELDVALVPHGTGSYTAIVQEKMAPELRSIIDSAVRQQAVSSTLVAQHVDPATLVQATSRAVVTLDAVKPAQPGNDERKVFALIAMVLMFFQILTFGLQVAMGVVEEKSSRVVEVLLATVKPLHLLCGKVLGLGALGLAQLAAYGAVGLGTGMATGLLTVPGVAVGVFASVLFWFILGFAFFAVVYAAAGSLVSRQEDVNSAATPITMLVFAGYFLAQMTFADPNGTVASVMSWVPPFSTMLMPLRIAAGTASPVQIVGSAVLMLLATAAVTLVAARIYERSVLRIGKRVSWSEALRARS